MYLLANSVDVQCFLADWLITSWIKKSVHLIKNRSELIWVITLRSAHVTEATTPALGHFLCSLAVSLSLGVFSGLLRSFASLAVQKIFIRYLLCAKHYATCWRKQSIQGCLPSWNLLSLLQRLQSIDYIWLHSLIWLT